jgi:drug/metabolite transporter superfamily protein YnfA
MSGDSTWAIVGPIVAVIGMLVFLFGARRRSAES